MLQALENWAATKPAGAELDSGRLAALTLNVAFVMGDIFYHIQIVYFGLILFRQRLHMR